MKIILMGDGAWGSALKKLLEENKHSVSVWKSNSKLPSGSIVVGAIPTQAIRRALEPSRGQNKITYINCAKGIEQASHKLPLAHFIYDITRSGVSEQARSYSNRDIKKKFSDFVKTT